MIEAVCTSKTSVYFNETTRCYIQEGCHLHSRRPENLKFQKTKIELWNNPFLPAWKWVMGNFKQLIPKLFEIVRLINVLDLSFPDVPIRTVELKIWLNCSNEFWRVNMYHNSWGSSVSIVCDYRLEDRPNGVRSLIEKRIFPLASVSRLALRPTQPPIQCRGPFPGSKARSGRDANRSLQVPKSRMSKSYTISPLSHACR
jgi:hypothetical protein